MARFDPVKLHSLLEVDRRGSISAAAKSLHLTPSAVSQHLTALERSAGVALLQRSAHGTRLTPAGRSVVRHAETIERALDSISHDLASPDASFELTIGFFPSVAPVLAAAISAHGERWPRCTLRTTEVAPEDAHRLVQLGDLDVALTVDWPHHPQPRSPEVAESILLTEPLLVAHSLGGRPGQGIARFAQDAWVAASAMTGCGAALRAACRRAGFEPDIRHETNDFNAAAALAAKTGCATVVPSVLGPMLPAGLATVAVQGLTRRILLISRHDVSPAVADLTSDLGRLLDERSSNARPRRRARA